jgi:hypothetical protein
MSGITQRQLQVDANWRIFVCAMKHNIHRGKKLMVVHRSTMAVRQPAQIPTTRRAFRPQ